MHVTVPPPVLPTTYGSASFWYGPTPLCNQTTPGGQPLAIIIPNIRGASNGGALVEGAGFGFMSSHVIARNYEITFVDPNVEDNCDFYNSIENQFNYRFAFITENFIWVSTYPVSVTHTIPIQEGRDTEVVVNVTVKFSETESICPIPRDRTTLTLCCPAP